VARKTFFSFYFERDNWRAANVRSSDNIKDEDEKGFIDDAAWESVKKKGDAAVEKWIDGQLDGTTVTVVLIGKETAGRKYINYEIEASKKRNNGLLGVYIHTIKNSNGETDSKGVDPFLQAGVSGIPTFDWKADDGRKNLSKWIEAAAKKAGR
jgi:MTH538 TIR-like domain (DUF1863)